MSKQQARRALPFLLLPLLLLAGAVMLPGACSREEPDPSCVNEPILKGPYVVAVTETEATVRWDSAQPGCAELTLLGEQERRIAGEVKEFDLVTEYRVDQSFADGMIKGLMGDEWSFEPDEPGPVHMREVRITDLQPGTCYEYRIRTGEEGPSHRFCTARKPGEKIRFAVIGDTMVGLGHAHPQLPHIAAAEPDFIIHTGDLQYYPGIFESWALWAKVMQPMFSTAAVFPCVGNHEFDSAAPTEFEDYYARYFHEPGMKGTTRWYTFQSAGVHFFSLDTESDLHADSDQGKWLESALAEAKQDPDFRFSVLYFHRPIYSLGRHRPRLDIREFLEPLYEPNGVKLVLVGHMHGYERFSIGDVVSITTGGGGAGLYSVNENAEDYPEDAERRQVGVAAYHFTVLEVEGDQISLKVIDKEGEQIDTHSWSIAR